MLERGLDAAIRLLGFGRFTSPIGAAGGGVERFAPEELHASGRRDEFVNLRSRDNCIELGEEIRGYALFPRIERVSCFDFRTTPF